MNNLKKPVSFITFLTLIFLFTGPLYAADRGNTTIQSFSKAKKILLRQVYYDHKTTFYCAKKVATKFRYMEADLYNLVPAVGEINGLRSNYSFAMIPGEKRAFGKCDMEIEGRKAEPPPDKRGNIARTYFYMNGVYPGHGIISKKNMKLFQAWDKRDPVDEWECERCKRIEKIQGSENPFVKKACVEKGLW